MSFKAELVGLMKIAPGTVIKNRYQIASKLGEGGFACVYKAEDMDLKRSVAIKVLKMTAFDAEIDRDRFVREARLLSKLSHPNIVSIFATDLTEDQDPFVAMEFLNGKSLGSFVAEKGKLDADTVLEIFRQICEGLSYVHKNNIVHRDLSPSNIYILEDDKQNLRVKLIDFGLAKCLISGSAKLTHTGCILGNPAYVSPETIAAKAVDQRSDIYSLGCVMYFAFSGSLPVYSNDAVAMLFAHQNYYPQEFTLNLEDKNEASRLKAIVLRCLQKDPNMRFQSCEELMQALCNSSQSSSQILDYSGKNQHGEWSSDRAPTKRQKSRLVFLLSLASVIFLFVLCQGPNLLEQALLTIHSPAFSWAQLRLAEYLQRKSPDRAAALLENMLKYNMAKTNAEKESVFLSLFNCYRQLQKTERLFSTIDESLDVCKPTRSLVNNAWLSLDTVMKSKSTTESLKESTLKKAILLYYKLSAAIIASKAGSTLAGNVAEALVDCTEIYGSKIKKTYTDRECGQLSEVTIGSLLAILKEYPKVHFSSELEEKIDHEIESAYLLNSAKDPAVAVEFLSLQLAQSRLNEEFRLQKIVLKVKCLGKISPQKALAYGRTVLKDVVTPNERFDLLLTLAQFSRNDNKQLLHYLQESKSIVNNAYSNYDKCFLFHKFLAYCNREALCYAVPLNIRRQRAIELSKYLPNMDELGVLNNVQIAQHGLFDSHDDNDQRVIADSLIQSSFIEATSVAIGAGDYEIAQDILTRLDQAMKLYSVKLKPLARESLESLRNSRFIDGACLKLVEKLLSNS